MPGVPLLGKCSCCIANASVDSTPTGKKSSCPPLETSVREGDIRVNVIGINTQENMQINLPYFEVTYLAIELHIVNGPYLFLYFWVGNSQSK